MRTVSLLLAAALCAAASPAHALTADELVAKNLEARGGKKKLQAIQSLRITGKAWFGFGDNGVDARYAVVKKRPGQIRQEVSLQGLTAIDAFDGKDGWSVQPFQGRRDPQRTSADEVKGLAREALIDGQLASWQEKGHQVTYLGIEDVDGTPAHKLRVQLKDGDTDYVYLDPDLFLEIRVVTESRTRGVEHVTETDLGSYAEVAGVLFPFSIEQGPKGRARSARFTIEKAEADVALDDALFRFPAAGTKVAGAIEAGPGAAEAKAPAAKGSGKAKKPAPFDSAVVSGLGVRNIGSAAMSGRVSAVAARNEGGKTTVYVGAASGGVWKSLDGGTTFKPIFDRQPVQSIGAIAIDPQNPKILWVGSGESWTRNSVSVGDGIYKSTDGGESWTNMGLPDSERVSRILVHPKNSDAVWACVPGRLWSDSDARGVYKTQDGGKSWQLVLSSHSLSAGCSGLSMDPADPEVLYAGLWDFRRKGWTFRSGGEGPEAHSASGLFRTADGGHTWTELTAEKNKGLPAGPWGRVEVAIAPSDSKVIYAMIESVSSALYRSSDGGATWEARDNSQGMVWRPFYFARLVVDPHDPDRLFKPGFRLIASEDGGRSFADAGGGGHGDWHDVWIDPDNGKHVIGGDDGGLWISHDGGSRWWKSNNLPISQFYHVSVDSKDPYQVYGGLQDNSSWAGDSSYPGGVTNQRWENLYGGDGFWTLVDPTDPEAVYAESQGGNVGRVDRRTHSGRFIQPQAGVHEKLRFNWNTPVALSPTEKGTLYVGAQFLFRSRDRGFTWERISPDLTSNDPEKQKQEQSGGITVDNSSAEMHTTIYSISESPLDKNTLWVGTDDGNVQLTRDAGKSWSNVVGNVPGLPKASWVSWVEASPHAAGTAFATFDRHTFGDLTPWVFRTDDFGKSWTRLVTPAQGVRGYAHVIKQDPTQASLLYLGTEFGLWISVDGGKQWAEFKGRSFPSVAVRDLAFQPRDGDLVIATHGRGIWIIDDLTPLRKLTPEVLSAEAAFLPGRPVQQRLEADGGWAEGDAAYHGESAPGGAAITWYQRTRHLFGTIKLEVFDAQGQLVDTLTAPKSRGVVRAYWNMRMAPPRVPRAAQVAFAASQGRRVLPGVYTVRLTKGGQVIETTLTIGLDRRADYGEAERKEQFEAVGKAHALFSEMTTLVERIDAAAGTADADAAKVPQTEPLGSALRALSARLSEVKKEVVATKEGGAITGEERLREHLDSLYGALNFYEGKPAPYLLERLEALRTEQAEVVAKLEKLLAEEARPLDGELQKRGLKPIPTGAPAHGEGERSEGGGQFAEELLRCLHAPGDCADETRSADRR